MSWMPSADPMLGDKRSCDALELVVVPRVRDLGNGFAVRRAMPNEKRQLVGPFIFFDQMGPVQFLAGQGMDVRPHPHIGLATVTYLFDGRVMHRDSEGNALEITPGAMNLMTAGPVGLFIDDGALALAIIMIVLLSGVLSVRVEVGGKNRVDERTKSGRLRLFGFGRQKPRTCEFVRSSKGG